MNESIDTLRLRLTDYEIKEDARILVQPSIIDFATGETEEIFLHSGGSTSIPGAKAFLNTPNYNFTLNPKGAFLQTSIPKYFHGTNEKYVTGKQTEQVLKRLETDLKEKGINTNIFSTELSRVDIFRQSNVRYLTTDYTPVFTLLQGKRQKKRDYGTTYLFYNTQRELSFYDKVVENKIRNGYKDDSPSHTLRSECRLLRKRPVNKATGLITAKDLTKEYGILTDVYKKELAGVFRYSTIDTTDGQLYLAVNDIERELLYLRDTYGRLTMRELKIFIGRKGIDFVFDVMNMETFVATSVRMTTNKNKRDVRSKINKYLQELMYGERAVPSKIKELYEELYMKFAV